MSQKDFPFIVARRGTDGVYITEIARSMDVVAAVEAREAALEAQGGYGKVVILQEIDILEAYAAAAAGRGVEVRVVMPEAGKPIRVARPEVDELLPGPTVLPAPDNSEPFVMTEEEQALLQAGATVSTPAPARRPPSGGAVYVAEEIDAREFRRG